MLGTEYNWLVSLSPHPTNGSPQVRMASSGLLTLAVAVFCFLCVALRAAPTVENTGGDETTWAITGMDGIIEGLALHPSTHEAFFSDVRNRCIWYRDVSGASAVMRKFSAESDGLPGVFALKFSADGGTLWASTSAVPEMIGFQEADRGRGFLAAYDLHTRKLRATYPLPADGRPHVLGDFLILADGDLLATDSLSPVIWRLAANGTRLEKWLEHADFKSLQGIATGPDERFVYITDYAKGLWRIDRATRECVLLPAPAGANLRGLDGLYAAPGGLVAVQNGTKSQRILRLALDSAGGLGGVTTLREGHPAMTDLSLGQVVQGHFNFIGNSGWELFGNPAAHPPARDVVILRAELN